MNSAKVQLFLFLVLIVFQVSFAQRRQNRKFPAHILRKINEKEFLNSEAWKKISNRHGLEQITWNTTLPSSEQVRETAIVSESKNVIFMTSRNGILKEAGYDNYVTMMDFETGLVAFRVRLPVNSQFSNKRNNLPRRKRKLQRKRGSMSRRIRNLQKRFKSSKRNGKAQRRNGGKQRRNRNGRGRGRNASKPNRKMKGIRKFRKALLSGNEQSTSRRRQRLKRMRKFFGGRFQACFIGQMDTTLTDIQEELIRRNNANAVLVGIPKTYVAEQKNRIDDEQLRILSPRIARFCRGAGSVFRLVPESTVDTDSDTINILGQFDASQISTSVPYEIHLESTNAQSKTTTVQPETIVSSAQSQSTAEQVPVTNFPFSP